MTSVTRHDADVVTERWAMATYQHGRYDGMEEVGTFDTEEDAVAAAMEWASAIPNDETTQHEAVVMKVVHVFKGPRTFADI